MAGLLIILWISGGASRADVVGQVVTRAAAWLMLIALVLAAPLPRLRPVAPVAFFVLASIILVALQLIPLPPSIWTALPGRQQFTQVMVVSGQPQPWRPLSISPGATLNALGSLIVPFLTLWLAASLKWTEQHRLLPLLLALIVASSLIGALQFSGVNFDHPLINDVTGSVSASFANRNHLALFVAIGCVLAPAWGFDDEWRTRWKGPVAIGLVLFFALTILATGSRTGILVGAVGIAIGLFNVRRRIVSELRRLPRPVAISLIVVTLTVLVTPIVLSIVLGRAVSLDRALAMDVSEDLRRRALPTVWEMAKLYFPFGSGIGTFDPVYRIHEPDALLDVRYFNHAHNDWLEIVLDAGLAGTLLLGSAFAWWLWKSVGAWRTKQSHEPLPRLGSAIVLLTLMASATDYPARTPMIMALLVIAAVWLNGNQHQVSPSADPGHQHKPR